ncbi:MAG: acyl-ACP--UDP-N-acetylglucosamine O-acyltransferase [Candidatus Omnitrophota bacterium]
MNVHSTAIISKGAVLSDDVEIGPYAVIEDRVSIGRRVKIYAHAHILGHTSIGDDCQVHIGAVLGHAPQIRKASVQTGKLCVGNRNIFREYATVHRSSKETTATVIGDDNYFMAFSHIAHDCNIGNNVTVCNGALIAGHAIVEDFAFISGNVTIHQFCRIGRYAMVGGLARISKDVPPYMLVKGDSLVWAVNSVGLRRANFSLQSRIEIKKAFKLLYKSGLNVTQAAEKLAAPGGSAELGCLVAFIRCSQRGICRHKQPALGERLSGLWPNKLHQAYRLFQNTQRQLI